MSRDPIFDNTINTMIENINKAFKDKVNGFNMTKIE